MPGGELQTDILMGRDHPGDLKKYKLLMHCSACTINRREMLNRLPKAQKAGVPLTNYGVTISFLQGITSCGLSPFPSSLWTFENKLKN